MTKLEVEIFSLYLCLKSKNKTRYQKITFVGSRLTRPQARAATPLQLRETATMPIESGPGYNGIKNL